MFIYNIKLDGSKLFKIIFTLAIIIALVICGIVVYKIYSASMSNSCVRSQDITVLTNKDYTNVLQAVHDNIDTYVGQKIKYSGFIYRVYDFDKEQFVLGRNMMISSDFQSLIVGFLCHYKNAPDFADNTWVELEGTITKGTYHGDMPIIEVTAIKKIDKPNDEYVYPPNANYIPTSSL